MPIVNWSLYYANVITDFRELKEYYPFCSLIILPTASPKPARIRVVAANKGLIEMTRAVESDFLGAYSRELTIEVPINYRRLGCKVFGANWLDLSMFEIKDLHISRIVSMPTRFMRFPKYSCIPPLFLNCIGIHRKAKCVLTIPSLCPTTNGS